MRFEPESLHGANNGLNIARNLLDKIKAKYPWISYGDLWTLAGVAAVQVSENQCEKNILDLKLTALILFSVIGNGWPQDSLEARPYRRFRQRRYPGWASPRRITRRRSRPQRELLAPSIRDSLSWLLSRCLRSSTAWGTPQCARRLG